MQKKSSHKGSYAETWSLLLIFQVACDGNKKHTQGLDGIGTSFSRLVGWSVGRLVYTTRDHPTIRQSDGLTKSVAEASWGRSLRLLWMSCPAIFDCGSVEPNTQQLTESAEHDSPVSQSEYNMWDTLCQKICHLPLANL